MPVLNTSKFKKGCGLYHFIVNSYQNYPVLARLAVLLILSAASPSWLLLV
ncbi:MAG: hypothetical protein II131_03125 [Neisseriaceae bacterium]|nr:hypothetical protein [Neisseriaceae bacterium]